MSSATTVTRIRNRLLSEISRLWPSFVDTNWRLTPNTGTSICLSPGAYGACVGWGTLLLTKGSTETRLRYSSNEIGIGLSLSLPITFVDSDEHMPGGAIGYVKKHERISGDLKPIDFKGDFIAFSASAGVHGVTKEFHVWLLGLPGGGFMDLPGGRRMPVVRAGPSIGGVTGRRTRVFRAGPGSRNTILAALVRLPRARAACLTEGVSLRTESQLGGASVLTGTVQ